MSSELDIDIDIDNNNNNNNEDWIQQSLYNVNDDETSTTTKNTSRAVCAHCERPKPATCYCPALPDPLIEFKRSHCLVLQHPHELCRKNRSLPIVQHSVHSNSLTVVQGRRFRVETENSLSHLITKCSSNRNNTEQNMFHQTWLIFPGPNAVTLSMAMQQLERQERELNTTGFVTVLFLDATWQYACEMDRTLQERDQYPNNMIRIGIHLTDLPVEQSFHPRRFEIRKARADDQFCTAEAISRVLAILEHRNEIHDLIMKPLDLMVSQWKSFQEKGRKEKPESKKKVDR